MTVVVSGKAAEEFLRSIAEARPSEEKAKYLQDCRRFFQQMEYKRKVSYDEDGDILVLPIQDNRPCVTVECQAWLRIDPETQQIISIEIPNFSKVLPVTENAG